MANKTFYAVLLRPEQINSGESYRVKFSYGTFSIYAKKISSSRAANVTQAYYYAHKRKHGKLYKVYIGKCGNITREKLHEATIRLIIRIEADDARERI